MSLRAAQTSPSSTHRPFTKTGFSRGAFAENRADIACLALACASGFENNR